jgi:Polysaccharide pyruvyl transferase
MPELFVVGTGQEDNIGDVVLRRECFDRLRSIGRLHLLMGATSADFLSSLRLDDSDIVYESLREWRSAAWRALPRGRVWFVDKPGELKLDSRVVRRQWSLLPLMIAIRLRRGQLLRLGMAVRAVRPRYLRRLRPFFRLSTLVRWRDTETRAAFGLGEVGPDWAFGWDETDRDTLLADRTDIVISYRGDRDPPSDLILEQLQALRDASGRRLVVVTQVRRDSERSAYLASRLDAELVDWPEERGLEAQEDVLRAAFRTCAMVVSDRLHVLILAMTEGAVPLCITDEGESKVARHLDAAGFYGSTVCVGEGVSLGEVFTYQMERRLESLAITRAALKNLDDLTAQLTSLEASVH